MTLQDALRHAEPYIESSLRRSNPDGDTINDVLQQVVTGNARLWIGKDSAAVTQNISTELIWHAGGEGEDLIQTLQHAADQMRRAGVERLTIEETRKGWAKRLRPYGFEPFTGLGLYL